MSLDVVECLSQMLDTLANQDTSHSLNNHEKLHYFALHLFTELMILRCKTVMMMHFGFGHFISWYKLNAA